MHFEGAGAGSYTFIGEATASVVNVPTGKNAEIGAQYTVVTAKSLGSDSWTLIGNLLDTP